jgi:hypothetical protein
MPDLTSQAATFRAGNYAYTGYLAIIPQTVVCTSTVDSTPTFPAMSLTMTVTAGAAADIERGMTVRVESSGGVFKGLLRVASTGTLSATILPINEVAAGTVNIAATDVLKIVAEYRIWDKLVSATAALNKDSRLAYAAQLADPPPVANAGGAAVGWGATASIAFDASTSYAVDPDNTGGLTYAWDFGDGTPATSATATETVSFPAGFRWIKLTVTDADNSAETEKLVPVWVFDNSTLTPTKVIMSALEGDARNGWRASFELVDSDASITTLPDGALVVYVERETYAGTEASYGSNVSGRSNIKFIGYLTRDTISIEPDSDTVRFDAEGPLGILERTPALTQLMISDSTPANWQEVKTLTVQRALWYLWHWQTTVGTLFDTLAINGGSLGNLSLLRIAVTDVSSAAGQLRDLATATNLLVSADRLGRLTFVREFDYLDSTDRTARVKTLDLTTADVMVADITREHRGTTKFVRGEGLTTAGAAVFANAPGNAPSPLGASSETFSRQIVSNQADLNTRAGLHFAKSNGLYNGQFVPRGVTLTLPDGYDVFEPAYGEAVTLTLAAATNKRGVSFGTGTRWTVPRVSINHEADSGAKTVRLTLDHETTGVAAVTYVPPVAADIGLNIPSFDFSYEFPGFFFDFDTSRTQTGTGTIAMFVTDNYMYLTANFTTPAAAGGPAWAAVDLSALANWNGNLLDFVVDAYSPKYLGTGTEVNGWIATSTRLLRITDIFGTPALTSRHTFNAAPETNATRSIQASFGAQNRVVCLSYYGNDGTYPGTWATWTTDDSSYTETQVTEFYQTNTGFGVTPAVYVSSRNAGIVYAQAYTATGSGDSATIALYRSANGGSTWAAASAVTTTAQTVPLAKMDVPFNVTNDLTLLWGEYIDTGTTYSLYRSIGTSETDISPTGTYGPVGSRALALSLDNPDYAVCVGTAYIGSATTNRAWATSNLSNSTPTWTAITDATTNADLAYTGATITGTSNLYLWGTQSKIAYSDDGGVYVDSKRGNLTSTGTIMNICGG